MYTTTYRSIGDCEGCALRDRLARQLGGDGRFGLPRAACLDGPLPDVGPLGIRMGGPMQWLAASSAAVAVAYGNGEDGVRPRVDADMPCPADGAVGAGELE